jgi:hypothetical protein
MRRRNRGDQANHRFLFAGYTILSSQLVNRQAFAEHGGPDVLQLVDVEAPERKKPNDVLVRVRAAGVNPADCRARTRPSRVT